MTRRLALVAAGVLLLAAAWLAFGGVSSSGVSCGSWARPSYDAGDRAAAQAAVDTYGDPASLRFAAATGVQSPATLGSAGLQVMYACDDTRHQRGMWTLGVLAGALVIPAAVLFVGGGRRPDPWHDETASPPARSQR